VSLISLARHNNQEESSAKKVECDLGVIEQFPSRVKITEVLKTHNLDGSTIDFTSQKELPQGSEGYFFRNSVYLGLIIFLAGTK